MTAAYPLAWPQGLPRTLSRVGSKLKTTLPSAIKNVQDELRRFGNDSGKVVQNLVLSSNVTLTSSRPNDPGIAAYFVWDGVQCCIAVDRYSKIEENVQAIALIVEAERTKLRHGGLNIVRAAFRGYASLPPPASGVLAAPWHQVLGLTPKATLAEARAAYTEALMHHHPDKGGDSAKFNLVLEAWRQAKEVLK